MRNILLIILSISLFSCSRSQPTNYYLLTSDIESFVMSEDENELAIGVGPISLPQYLDREGIVERIGENGISISDSDRWGESLSHNILRVLAKSFQSSFGRTTHVYPWRSHERVGTTYEFTFHRFERVDGGAVQLEVETLKRDGENSTRSAHSISTPCDSGGYDGTASCMSKALRSLVSELATQ